jgi:hypothetical protein
MSLLYLAGASAAHELARDAFDQGDALLGRRGPTNPPSRRSTGLTASSTSDLPVGTARPGGQAEASHDRARPSRSAYDSAHRHYLNAAHLHHSGTPRNPCESPNETIARLPGALREAITSAHQDYQRDVASLDGHVDEDALLERTERYLERLRDELEAWDPRVFGDREHPTDTSPTR